MRLTPDNIARDSWRFFPHTYAQRASPVGDKWKPYKHLVHLSNTITPGIVLGGGRYIVSMPPRHGKSEFISNWVPTWFLENFPHKKIILASYSAEFAADWGRKVKNNILNNPSVSVQLRQDSTASSRFNTVQGGGMITAGAGGPITGRGADLLIIDDPFKGWKEAMSEHVRKSIIEWWKAVIRTRLEPGATVIVVQTRWHEEDLAGFLQAVTEDQDADDDLKEDWTVLNLPAIAQPIAPGEAPDPLGRKPGEALCPDRYDINELKLIRHDLGGKDSMMWCALYQGSPVAMEGELWKRSHWRHWSVLPKFDQMIQSWDFTFKDPTQQRNKAKPLDFVVGQVWGRAKARNYLIDQVRGQWGFSESCRQVMLLTTRWPKARKKLFEAKANGPAIENSLNKIISGIELLEPQGGKYARATAALPSIMSGNALLPLKDVPEYPWVKGFINEGAAFPRGKNDDQVDTASQALCFLDLQGNDALRKLVMM